MAEWPKHIKDAWEESADPEGEYVIPADLGRELYEALKSWDLYTSPIRKELNLDAMDRALARYEREVGE